ncbi:2-oxoglutarate dehydrogenase E1 component [Marinilongibacter aquaticus]|uniref:2-oxoglutarate dehydrogenase E1 component n=1 Tax=Marinilongibacter aquaticus TaxID=2975157 RepID=UPI0021BDD778|nr:2-oxoglutarate dehydrogenase E1 component [Marinilongibacter aquaticus]UBM60493.1 2-oxoglutarate dehydrogenase E1 component [Marinilongibacter aquaticus]
MDQYSFVSNADVLAIESLYQQYKENPQSVDESWQNFFKGFDFSETWKSNGHAGPAKATGTDQEHIRKEIEVVHLIRGIRARGHMAAKIDPLYDFRKKDANLTLQDFNLSESDLDTVFEAGHEVFGRPATLREIDAALRKVYMGNIGFEYQYIRDRRIKSWFRKKLEGEFLNFKPSIDQKKRILKKLNQAVAFESFLHTKFLGKKRFSLEGGESAIPGLDAAITKGSELGVEEVVIGMAHRGRLNVLTNILQKPYEQVFNEFEENVELEQYRDGDVKYHMGYTSQISMPSGSRVSMKLMANPSHLEAVDPVVLGYARARADAHYESGGRKVNNFDDIYDKILPIVIHGDSSLAGQGIVYEVTQMSNLPGYYVGGALHFIINNQVGFTTDNDDARSSLYSSDVAKILDTPIFHVNGDDPEAVVYAMQLAIEFRQEFNKDVFVDMICYRKHGHNEADEPRFTQPTMYQIINKHKNVREIYLQKLREQGDDNRELAKQLKLDFNSNLQDLLAKVKQRQLPYEMPKLEQAWRALRTSGKEDFEQSPETGISEANIQAIGHALSNVPEGFKVLKQIAKVLEERESIFKGEKEFNWAAAELMAFGSILNDGRWIRFSGQDVERGTFSHRHSVLHETDTNETYNNLEHIREGQGKFEIYNSFLSEYAVMGFEYGYAMANPDALVVWEAQFGDFANGAQIMIDQFVSAAESKWKTMNGLVLLLPHGYEGQGPEHSNARPERFLQLSAEYNMYVCACTTPANFFHMLRRQLALPFRKPCVHMSPKSMLRHPKAISTMNEFEPGTRFMETYGDTYVDDKKVKRVLLCSGKLYYDLLEKQQEENRKDVAIVRVEQLYPFPKKQVVEHINKYPKAETYWVQEEPRNMGAWSFILREFPEIGIEDVFARKESASPATGYTKYHLAEQQDIVNRAFDLNKK